jgi:hypothetical protein
VRRRGPVREVTPQVVLEVTFDSVGRYKSDVAMRFQRIQRIRCTVETFRKATESRVAVNSLAQRSQFPQRSLSRRRNSRSPTSPAGRCARKAADLRRPLHSRLRPFPTSRPCRAGCRHPCRSPNLGRPDSPGSGRKNPARCPQSRKRSAGSHRRCSARSGSRYRICRRN